MKNCKKCNFEKNDEDFRHNRRVCKECEKKHGREYRKNNKDKSKKWADENKEKMKELQHKWYTENKSQITEKFKKRYHDSSSDFKKIKNYRTAICHMIGGHQKTNKYIGCNSDFLKKWITMNFDDKMSYDNYGEYWVIDHVIPLDMKDKYDFEILSKWYNICPMEKNENLVKNKYINTHQVKKHSENLQKFNENKKIASKYLEILAKHLVAGTSLEP